MLEDRALRRRLAQAGRERVASRFDLRRQTAELQERYDEVRSNAGSTRVRSRSSSSAREGGSTELGQGPRP